MTNTRNKQPYLTISSQDVPIRKSDRRKLRDRVLEILFTGGGDGKEDATKNE